MKFLGVLLLLGLPLCMALPSQSQVVVAEDLSVPGENKLIFCEDPKDYIYSINYIDITPNPPVKGANMSIVANIDSPKGIESGAKLSVAVKYGWVTILKQELDFCDALDVKCPVEKGNRNFTKELEIPGAIPSGTYSIVAEAWTKEGKEAGDITCVHGGMVF